MGEVGIVLWLALAAAIASGVVGLRYAIRWWDWRLATPVACLFLVSTGPLLAIAERAGFLSLERAQTLLEYRWLLVTVLALVSVVAVSQIFERGRRVYADLLASEERFRSISRVLPVGVFQADVDGRAVYANDGALEMLGISLGDAIGEGWMRSLHPEDRDRVMEEWQAASLDGKDFRSEYRFVTIDGGVIWVLGHVLALKDEDGDVVGHVGAITDITERKSNELELELARATLERRVVERTTELVREVEHRRQAEAALADSEARLRAILDNTPSYIWVKDLAGHYVYLNEPTVYPDEIPLLRDLRGKTDIELFPAAIAEQITASDAQVIATGAVVHVEDTIDVPRGRRTYVTTKFPLRDAVGRIYGVGGVATDATERVQTTQAIERVYKLSPLAMSRVDWEGRVTLANPAFARALGYAEQEVLGRHYIDLVCPEDQSAARDLERALKEDERTASIDVRMLRKDGRVRLFAWEIASIHAEHAFYGVGRDITEQAQQMDAIRRVYRLSPVIMCTFDWGGTMLVMNPVLPAALGYGETELLGRRAVELLHPDDVSPTLERFRILTAEETTLANFEMRVRCKDGAYRVLSWDISSAPAERRLYGVARDVTEARKIEREMAERRDQMAHLLRLQTMGEMASEIAHELNQPLSAIVNYARGASNRLRSADVLPAELSDLMEKVATQALRAGDLIRRIRSYARKADLETESCDINDLVRNALNLLNVGRRMHAKLKLVLDGRLPKIDADAIQIEQVILNLVRNGIEAASQAGQPTLTIRTDRSDANEVRLSVTDNGPGLKDVGVDEIFEPFYTTKSAGLGLGLSISRTIVQAHGGRIWAESDESGGSTFLVVLPVGRAA